MGTVSTIAQFRRVSKPKGFPNIPNIEYGSRVGIMDHVLDDTNNQC